MKLIFKKTGIFLLTFLMLLSTFSFVVDSHYCGEFLVDTSFFGKADSCGMKKAANVSSKNTTFKRKSCCKNSVEFITTSNFKKQEFLKISQKQVYFVITYTYSLINIFKKTPLKKEFYTDFSPPDIEKKYQILFQTFLI